MSFFDSVWNILIDDEYCVVVSNVEWRLELGRGVQCEGCTSDPRHSYNFIVLFCPAIIVPMLSDAVDLGAEDADYHPRTIVRWGRLDACFCQGKLCPIQNRLHDRGRQVARGQCVHTCLHFPVAEDIGFPRRDHRFLAFNPGQHFFGGIFSREALVQGFCTSILLRMFSATYHIISFELSCTDRVLHMSYNFMLTSGNGLSVQQLK